MSVIDPLANHQAGWRGTKKLWLDGPDVVEISPGRIDVIGNTVKVSWAFRGAAHTGLLQLEETEDTIQAEWTDSWHAEDGMALTGEAFADAVDVFGTYPPGDGGPDWGWRIVLDTEDAERLLLRMYNITPEGDETIAVELEGRR